MKGDGCSRRAHARHDVLLKARVMDEGRWHDCSILNISAGGVKLQLDHPIGQGTAVMLELGNFGQFNGTVVWQHGGGLGIKFSQDPSKMAEVLMGLALYG